MGARGAPAIVSRVSRDRYGNALSTSALRRIEIAQSIDGLWKMRVSSSSPVFGALVGR